MILSELAIERYLFFFTEHVFNTLINLLNLILSVYAILEVRINYNSRGN